MVKSSYIILCLLFAIQLSFAQDGRYAIFFNDKSGSTFSVDNPIQFLSQRSIDRRTKNNVQISEEDLPVNVNYINQVKGLGADILHSSRWMNCAIVQLEGDELNNILLLPFVSSSDYLGPSKPDAGGRKKRVNQKKDSNLSLVNQLQISMLGIDDMHKENIFGEGVVIGVFDSGFIGVDSSDPFKSLLEEGRLQFTLDIAGESNNVFQYDDHGSEVLSIMAANQMGTYVGGTPKSTYQLYVTEDVASEFRIEEYNWLVAAEKADSAGVDIINSSLGYTTFDDASMDYTIDQLDGNTAIVSLAAAKALNKGMLVVVSAGNDGNTPWKLVNPPADAEGVLAVGSITGVGNLSNFSSIGPTADGRIKPDVVALGSSVSVIKANGTVGFSSGTSASTPLITSLAAGLLQTFPNLTAKELYELIINSGNMNDNPDNQKGYGVPHYLAAKSILNGEEPPMPTSAIHLYPNPATGNSMEIEIDVTPGQVATIYIYSLQGKLVMKSAGSVTYENNPIPIDVSQFSPGLYIVKVETEGVLKTIRLVKL